MAYRDFVSRRGRILLGILGAAVLALIMRGALSIGSREVRRAESGQRRTEGEASGGFASGSEFKAPPPAIKQRNRSDAPQALDEDEQELEGDDELEQGGGLSRYEQSSKIISTDISSDELEVQASPAPVASGANVGLPRQTERASPDANEANSGATRELVARGPPDGNLLTQLQGASDRGAEANIGALDGDADAAQMGFRGGGLVPARSNSFTSPAPAASLLPWVHGQARGYAMLYAMQPEARSVVEANIQALLESRIREPYIGVLIDGTFGQDYQYLRDVISRLSADGRRLSLALYLANGSTMRVGDRAPIATVFSRINPGDFRDRIVREGQLRRRYSDIAVQAQRIFEASRAINANNSNIAVVMLEDNLDRDSFRAMRELVKKEVGESVTIVRNPCLTCYSGNDRESLGSPVEEHDMEYFDRLGKGDGFTLDGASFSYPGEVSGSQGVSPDDVLRLVRESASKGMRYFGLWRVEWQGGRLDALPGHPATLKYRPSSEEQRAFEVKILREGLNREESVSE